MIGATVAILTAAAAMAVPPIEHDPALVRAGLYRIDPAHSVVSFGLSHLGISEFTGRSGQIAGVLRLDPADPSSASVEIELPTESIDTPSAKLNTVLQTTAWLDGASFPVIRFRSTRVMPTTTGNANVEGSLTLHGVTRPLTLALQFAGAVSNPRSADYTIGFRATGSFNRSSFGVGVVSPTVGDQISLTIAVELIREH